MIPVLYGWSFTKEVYIDGYDKKAPETVRSLFYILLR